MMLAVGVLHHAGVPFFEEFTLAFWHSVLVAAAVRWCVSPYPLGRVKKK